MYISVVGKSSHQVPVISGVPQGSVLDPILFLIYVINSITCNFKLFADDIKLYLSFDVTDISSGITVGQDNISCRVKASDAWVLSMNVSKCACVRFSRRKHHMEFQRLSSYYIIRPTPHISKI